MKLKLTFFALAFIIGATPAYAAFLITDPMAGVTQYDIEIDGTVVEDVAAEADGSLRFNVDSLAAGDHTFRVKPEGQGGWPADWSPPFGATKPATSSGLRIVE